MYRLIEAQAYAVHDHQPYCMYVCTCLGSAKIIHSYAFTLYVRYFQQGNIYRHGLIRCVYTVLANPINKRNCEHK